MAEENENSKQEVSTALELLISTLADERKRIYRVGADAMQAQDGDTALAVIGFAKKLEINRVWYARLVDIVYPPCFRFSHYNIEPDAASFFFP